MLLLVSKGHAQQWEIGANAGATGFMGDINPTSPFYFQSAGGGLNVNYNLNSTWGFQLSYNFLHLHGSDYDDKDPYRLARGQMFSNKVNELSLRANFNFFKFIPGQELNRYTPYLFAGLGVMKHNPYVVLTGGDKVNLEDLKLQEHSDISKMALVIPFGAGFKYNIKGPWSIGAEIGYRTAFNDNIDNVSNSYHRDVVTADAAAVAAEAATGGLVGRPLWDNLAFPDGANPADYYGKQKGNGKTRDGYMTAGVTLTFTFISKDCYWWK